MLGDKAWFAVIVKFIPKMFDRVEVKVLYKPLKEHHTKGKGTLNLHYCSIALDQKDVGRGVHILLAI